MNFINSKLSLHLRLCFLFIVYGSSLIVAKAQEVNTDSLLKVAAKEKDDSNKVNTYNDLSWYLKNKGLYKKADSFGRQALYLSENIGYTKGIGDAWMSIGNVYDSKGDFLLALESFNKALKARTDMGDWGGSASSINNIGNVFNAQGDFPRALDYYLQGLQMAEKAHDKVRLALVYGNLGNVYNDMHDYLKALDYMIKGAKMQGDVGDKNGVGITYVNIGSIYMTLKRFDKALDYTNQGITLLEGADDKRGLSAALSNMGYAYYCKGDMVNGMKYTQEALTLADSIGDKQGVAGALTDIGNIYVVLKKYDKALASAEKSLQIAREMNALGAIENAEELLTHVYEASGDKLKALAAYKAYITARDSLYNKENTRKVVQSEMNYDFDKKQAAEKAEQDKKDALEQEDAYRQRIILYGICGVLALVIGFAIFAYRSYMQKQKANQELDEKNHKIEGAYKIITEKNHEITDSINYAQTIQNAMLPTKEEVQKHLPQSFILYKPKDIVSGDFYFAASLNPSKGGTMKGDTWNSNNEPSFGGQGGRAFVLAAADCTGHGVPGAFMSLIGNEKLKDAVEQYSDTGAILKALNKGIKMSLHQSGDGDSTRDGMDIALVALTQNPLPWGEGKTPSPEGEGQRMRADFSGANRPLWIIRKGKQEIEEIKPTKKAIGGFTDEHEDFATHTIDLKQGDTFYIFSDGYADQFGGEAGRKLTTKKFRELLLSLKDRTMEEQEKALEEHIVKWMGSREQLDDILVIGVRV